MEYDGQDMAGVWNKCHYLAKCVQVSLLCNLYGIFILFYLLLLHMYMYHRFT